MRRAEIRLCRNDWCRSILKKGAVHVLSDLFGLQNFRSYLEPNDSTLPIELVLLDVVKAIRLVSMVLPSGGGAIFSLAGA